MYLIGIIGFSKTDLLAGQFGLIFVRNIEALEVLYFLLLNSFDFSSLILNLLSDFSAFFKIIKSILLLFLFVLNYLGSKTELNRSYIT